MSDSAFIVGSRRGWDRIAFPVASPAVQLAGLRLLPDSGLRNHCILRMIGTAIRLRILPVVPGFRIGHVEWLVNTDAEARLTLILEELGHPSGAAALVLPPPEEKRFSALLISRSGASVAFAKFGFDEASQGALAREIDAQRFLGDTQFRSFRAPKQLLAGSLEKYSYLVTSVLPQTARLSPAGDPWEESLLAPLTEIATSSLRLASLDTLPWWRERAPDRAVQDVQQFVAHHARGPVELCVSHGDYSRGNIAVARRGEVWIYDWEEFEPAAPRLADWLYYCLTTESRLRGRRDASAFARRAFTTLVERAPRADVVSIGLALVYMSQRRSWSYPSAITQALAHEVMRKAHNHE